MLCGTPKDARVEWGENMNHRVHPASFETNNRTYSRQNNIQHILSLTAVVALVAVVILVVVVAIIIIQDIHS
jgi:hypothetical protein